MASHSLVLQYDIPSPPLRLTLFHKLPASIMHASALRLTLLSALLLFTLSNAANVTVYFQYTNASQSWVVPSEVSSITIQAAGEAGGTINGDNTGLVTGGLGQIVTATISVTPGETLGIFVGGMG